MATGSTRSIQKLVKDYRMVAAGASITVENELLAAKHGVSRNNQQPYANSVFDRVGKGEFKGGLLRPFWSSLSNTNSAYASDTPRFQFLWQQWGLTCHRVRVFHTQPEEATPNTFRKADEKVDIDWDGLGFSMIQTDYMYVMKCGNDGEFYEGDLQPFGCIELHPSAGVLNYAQGLFEGLKAYRTMDGRIVLFRPKENALRMQMGAERLYMAAPSVEQFVNAMKQIVLANKRWIPPFGKGSLYIRALLMGSGPVLGLGPAPEVTFIIFASPVGNYYKEGLKPIQLQVETKFHRATPGGTGAIKSIGNYGPMIRIVYGAKEKGFTDVLYLDSINKKYIEEVSSCNIFIVKGNLVSTPALHGTILPGVTRKSIIELACSQGYEVQERLVSIDEVLDADEVFCTGTAVVVSPVGSITYLDKRVTYRSNAQGGLTQKVYSSLTSIQTGLIEDDKGWTMELI